MTTGAAEGRTEMSGANSEWSGRKPKGAGAGAASVTGRKDKSTFEAERLMEAIISRGNMMAAHSRVERETTAMNRTMIEIENDEAFFLCLALGTLKAIRAGAWPPDAGIWSLAYPAFRESIEQMNLNKEILDIFEGADELAAIEKLMGRQALDEQIDTWIQTLCTGLGELRVKSWSARIQHEECSTRSYL